MSWYLSPGGHPTHADGPDQVAALEGRGYKPISDAEAHDLVSKGVDLRVDSADAAGTFDDEAVARAVADEAHAKRSAAARKAAETRAAKKATAAEAAPGPGPEATALEATPQPPPEAPAGDGA